jgi:hypothetical protein
MISSTGGLPVRKADAKLSDADVMSSTLGACKMRGLAVAGWGSAVDGAAMAGGIWNVDVDSEGGVSIAGALGVGLERGPVVGLGTVLKLTMLFTSTAASCAICCSSVSSVQQRAALLESAWYSERMQGVSSSWAVLEGYSEGKLNAMLQWRIG